MFVYMILSTSILNSTLQNVIIIQKKGGDFMANEPEKEKEKDNNEKNDQSPFIKEAHRFGSLQNGVADFFIIAGCDLLRY